MIPTTAILTIISPMGIPPGVPVVGLGGNVGMDNGGG